MQQIGLRSRVAVPLDLPRADHRGLSDGSYTPNTYTAAHVSVAQQVADLIAPFIENIVLLHREQRRRSRLAALGGLAWVFGASLNLKESFEQVAQAVRPFWTSTSWGCVSSTTADETWSWWVG